MSAADANTTMKKSFRKEALASQSASDSTLIAKVPKAIQLRAEQLQAVLVQLSARASTFIKDPKVKVVSLSAGGGAITVGAVGGAAGLAMGSTTGFALGVIPSLFTFGLSMPVGAVVGGAVGTGTGVALGASTGVIGGGVVGNVAYAYRVELKDGAVRFKAKVVDVTTRAKATSTKAITSTKATVSKKTTDMQIAIQNCKNSVHSKSCKLLQSTKDEGLRLTGVAKTKACELKSGAKELAKDRKFQATAGGAVSGAAVCGAGGGAAGLATGTVVGAAVGLVPALFTFGLSIPVGAMIGGSTGLCVGATAGGSVGATAGGAIGYGAYTKRQEIKSTAGYLSGKVQDSASYVKGKAQDSASFVKTKIRGGTGGTA